MSGGGGTPPSAIFDVLYQGVPGGIIFLYLLGLWESFREQGKRVFVYHHYASAKRNGISCVCGLAQPHTFGRLRKERGHGRLHSRATRTVILF